MRKNNIDVKNNKKKIIIVIAIVVILVILLVFLGRTKKVKSNVYDNITDNTSDVKEEVNQDVTQSKLVPKDVDAVVPIFMYHFVLDDYGDNLDSENFIKPSTLEEQLKYISDNGYQTIFADELDNLYKYEKPVCLTFDDVFVYFYNNAYPLFKKYNQKATLFIITNYINGENYLTEDQIKEMADSGLISIESHTLSHEDLSKMTYEEQEKQAYESKERLEKLTGKQVTTYCYPYGRYNNDTIQIAKKQYELGLRMDGGIYDTTVSKDIFQIPRIYANRSMSIDTFASYLKKSSVKVKE